MKKSKLLSMIILLSFIASPLFGGTSKVEAQTSQIVPVSSSIQAQASAPNDEFGTSNAMGQMRTTTMAMRIAAAVHLNLARNGTTTRFAGISPDTAQMSPLANVSNAIAQAVNAAATDYFGIANWAQSPLPQLDLNGAITPNTGIRKFTTSLPTFCPLGTNQLGQCIPVAVPDTVTFPGSDYYEIAVVEYREQMSPDLPAPGTKLRGYVQVVPAGTLTGIPLYYADGTTPIMDRNGQQVLGATKPQYLGPMIIAQGCSLVVNPGTCVPHPVRIKFTNYLPTGPGGNLFIPVDTTYMGAGMGAGGSVLSIVVNNGGTGYTSAPSVSFTGGAGTGAAATATVINSVVTAVQVTLGGSGYTSAPTVVFTGGGGSGAIATANLAGLPNEMYTQNRATLHLHGGNSPWISDGTPHQWTTPYGEVTSYSRGESVSYVPDMWFDALGNVLPASSGCQGQTTCAVAGSSNDPGLGSLTFYWTNQQSGRLLFYHDHSYGITRLNVYAGEAAGYLIVDPTEEATLLAGGVPGTISDPANLLTNAVNDLTHIYPLVIQDKTFVPDATQLSLSDPTWDSVNWGSPGDLWFPHVYIPNQNPADVTGANNFGRWDYGPWFWPPQNSAGFVGQPYTCTSAAYTGTQPAFPPLMCPGTPNPSGTPEAFMDTPVINGTAYPTLTVDPVAYRFQMLMAGNDRTWNLGLYLAEPLTIALTKGGSGYTTAAVSFAGGGGSGAAATANISSGTVGSITITGVGDGYTVVPNVTIAPPLVGTTATAIAVIDPATSTISAIRMTNVGSGYTAAPLVTIDAPLNCTGTCTQATATANLTPGGVITSITITNPGTGWTSAPTVTITGDGTGAAAIASVYSEVKMVPAVPPTAASALPLCSQANPTSGAMLVTALVDGTGNPINGTGLPTACWPSAWPTDGRDGGVPDPTTAGPPFIQIGTESGVLPAPVIIPSTPVGYEYNRRSITVLNVFTHGLLLGPAERADVLVDFSQFAGQTLLLYNDAPAPVPAFDPRNDYYTGDPDQTMAGGAPSTMPGYGPNTRTIMQIVVRPTITIPGGNPLNLATVGPAVTNDFATQQGKMLIPEPDFPAGNGNALTPTYVPIQGTSLTGWYASPVGSVNLLNGGSGYSAAPTVSFQGGGGSGAAADLTFAGSNVSSLTLTASGSGYTSAPTVNFTGGGGTGAAASATITRVVNAVNVTRAGSGYTSPPTVGFTGGGGSGAAAVANITNAVNRVTVTAGGSGYTTAPTVVFTGGGGTGATATASIQGGRVSSITVTNGGSGYTSAPSVSFTGGGGTGAAATATITGIVASVTVTNGGSGYTSAPNVSFSGGGGSGARATASITGIVNALLLTNGGTGYTSAPLVGFTGGGGSGAAATASYTPGYVASLVLTNGGTGYTSAPLIVFTPNGALPTTDASAVANAPVMNFKAKAIQELFTLDYGRMNATLGVELPFTNFFIQTTIPYGYIDPPTEMFTDGETQIWKITHNGVDTHFIHFHLYDVQVLNRVGWDGMIKPPDVNEIAWKDTVRMNPLEDIIIALRPMKQNLPWDLPNSERPMDVTQPIGANNQANTMGFANIDPTNNPATVNNDVINYGWEYVVHCHILGHEENDMMRSQLLAVPPKPVANVTATRYGSGNTQYVVIAWTDMSTNETGFTVQRATTPSGPWLSLPSAPAAPGTGTAMSYTDNTLARRTTYYYQVVANNVVGYTQTYAAPVVGYPSLSADSAPTAAAAPITTLALGAPGPIFADSFETGLNLWDGIIGDGNISAAAVIGPNNGKLGMIAKIGPQQQPAYVFDNSPSSEVMYDANFYFDPNQAVATNPVDIFIGIDQNGQPIFGIQYQDIDARSFQLRSWSLINGNPVYSSWDVFATEPDEDDPEILTHKLDVAWMSGTSGGLSFYIDDQLFASMSGDTSASQLEEVILGPALGLSAGDTGSMYFDEFTSSRVAGVTYMVLMPGISR